MDQAETDALLAVTLMAAFSDGQKQDEERAHIKEVFESFGVESAPTIYRQVMLKQIQLDDVVRSFRWPEIKQYAYELAVGVCDADDIINSHEQAFLDQLRSALGMDVQATSRIQDDAAAVTQSAMTIPESAQAAPPDDSAKRAEADKAILKYAIFAAALELLPQTLATLAIVPVQVRLVYVIGSTYGYKLDAGHIKEFIGAIGVGLTSQYVEGAARKILGGFASKFIGGFGTAAAKCL